MVSLIDMEQQGNIALVEDTSLELELKDLDLTDYDSDLEASGIKGLIGYRDLLLEPDKVADIGENENVHNQNEVGWKNLNYKNSLRSAVERLESIEERLGHFRKMM